MKDTLADIRLKLDARSYSNEEQVRLAVVARLLQQLGWDIWNPRVVFPEFQVERSEDRTKVDFALFPKGAGDPSVYIEVKPVGGFGTEPTLGIAEKQLRDYNRNNTAPICVLTDGRNWRFYFAQESGEFRNKCFKVLDLLRDPTEEQDRALQAFLGKHSVESGSARAQAADVLNLSRRLRVVKDCIPLARQRIQEPPYPSLPDALVELVAEKGHKLSREEAEEVMEKESVMSPDPEPHAPGGRTAAATVVASGAVGDGAASVMSLDPENPTSLRFTQPVEWVLGGKPGSGGWNALVRDSILLALSRGFSVDSLKKILPGKVEAGVLNERGFHAIRGRQVSFQNQDADSAWRCALAIAKVLKVDMAARFRWANREDAMHPGVEGEVRWPK